MPPRTRAAGGRPAQPSRGRAQRDAELSESDADEGLIDEALRAGRGKISFGGEQEDDEIDEEAVYDLSDDESDSDDDEDDEDSDEEPDLDEEIERGGRTGRSECCAAAAPPPAAAATALPLCRVGPLCC
jgi:hypothetical protein